MALFGKKNPRRTTYSQRRAGAGIGKHMTRQIRSAQAASIDPKGVQVRQGLATVAAKKETMAHKVALVQAKRRRKARRGY